jgi:glycerol-3-phosphate acyltransferase PlsY
MGALRTSSAVVIGYLAGTIPSADLASRAASGGRIDLRTKGSGNPGAANAAKVLGTRWGLAVMVADVSKGAAACHLGRRVAGDRGAHVAGTAAVVGHCFPVWNGFRGGKGVATGGGQCLATFPAFFPIDLTLAALTSTSRGRRRALAATSLASVAWVAGALLWWRRDWSNLWAPPVSADLPLAAAVSSAVILQRFWAAERSEASG